MNWKTCLSVGHEKKKKKKTYTYSSIPTAIFFHSQRIVSIRGWVIILNTMTFIFAIRQTSIGLIVQYTQSLVSSCFITDDVRVEH